MEHTNQIIKLGLVSEVNTLFVNQSKLCLYSFRKNAGKLKDIPIVLVTNDRPLRKEDQKFFVDNFSPIELLVRKRIFPPKHAAKWNIFDAIPTTFFDIMIFLDCDTVICGPLDNMLEPLLNRSAEFICRRGGKTDREGFTDINNTIDRLGFGDSECYVDFEGVRERPMLNSGVFAFRSHVGKQIKQSSREILKEIMDKSQHHLNYYWPAEECALALAIIKNNITIVYLDECYNSWGDLPNLKILHCFKSRYKFDRARMFKDFDLWKDNYQTPEVPGEKMLTDMVEQYKKEFGV